MSKKIYVVTWTNHLMGQVGSDNIKCFDDHKVALGFVKLMQQKYNYVNFYEENVNQWDS